MTFTRKRNSLHLPVVNTRLQSAVLMQGGLLLNTNFPNSFAFKLEIFLIVLVTSAIMASGFYFLFYRRLQLKDKRREQRIKFLQIHTLQSQMNPHFIFNVLSSIQSLVLNEKTELANKYLISFANLIRKFLDSTIASNFAVDSYELEVTLRDEIELLNLYLDFERLQYDDKFDFELYVDESIDIDSFSIPPMIIQPFLENAIKHGLNPLDRRGKLSLRFYLKDEALSCEIEDDGVGRKKASEIEESKIKVYKSRGLELVRQRVDILNTLDYDIRIFTEDLTPHGTRVNIFFNLK